LSGSDYQKLLELSSKHELDAATEKWFQELKKVHDELDAIGVSAQDAADALDQAATGTTADAITTSIIQGFENGNKAVSDFADNFQSLMQQAILNSLSDKYLKTQLATFYEQFTAAAKSDNQLTKGEITDLQASYNEIIKNAKTQFDQLQKATGVNFSGGTSTGNAISGGIKAITEDTANVLAGQFGGLRITAMEQLHIAQSSLNVLQGIEANTSLIKQTNDYLRKFDQQGIKIQ